MEVDPMTDQGRAPADHAGPLAPEELEKIDAYWRAANYLSVGQIYLLDNPLLREPLRPSTSSRACSATGARRPA
jgi:phosphoketolase